MLARNYARSPGSLQLFKFFFYLSRKHTESEGAGGRGGGGPRNCSCLTQSVRATRRRMHRHCTRVHARKPTAESSGAEEARDGTRFCFSLARARVPFSLSYDFFENKENKGEEESVVLPVRVIVPHFLWLFIWWTEALHISVNNRSGSRLRTDLLRTALFKHAHDVMVWIFFFSFRNGLTALVRGFQADELSK